MLTAKQYFEQLSARCLVILSFTLVPGLIALFFLTKERDFIASTAYLPACFLISMGALLRAVFGLESRPRIYGLICDLTALCAILGALVIVYRAKLIGLVVTTSPIQTVCIFALALNFRSVFVGIFRNLLLMSIPVGFLHFFEIGFNDSNLFQLITGGSLGMAIYGLVHFSIRSNYRYKMKVFEEQAQDKQQIIRLHKELESKCMPHQLELIMRGRGYGETMPLEGRACWVGKFDIVKSSRLNFPNKKVILHDFFAEIWQLLHENYRFQDPYQAGSSRFGGAMHIESDGYLIKTAGDGYFVSYDYPLRLPESRLIGHSILLSSLRQFMLFKRSIMHRDASCRVSAVKSLVYGQLEGVFSGKLNNYELEGQAMTLAERYENARKLELLQQVEDTLGAGSFGLILQNKVYEQFCQEMPDYMAHYFERFAVTPHIRDDESGREIYVMFIAHNQIEQRVAELSSLTPDFRGVFDLSMRQKKADRVA